jgi:hypothetical protein
MWESEIEVDDWEVIDNGVVITYDDDPIRLTLKPDIASAEEADQHLSFVIKFEDTDEEPGLESEIYWRK